MSFPFFPDIILPSLTDLTPELLRAHGVDFLMLDFDNTIVPYTTDVPSERMRGWLEMMKRSGIRLCVVSNSHRPAGLHHARKKAVSERHPRMSAHLRPAAGAGGAGRGSDLYGRAGREKRRPDRDSGPCDPQSYRLAEATARGRAAIYRRRKVENRAARKKRRTESRKNLIILFGYLEKYAALL